MPNIDITHSISISPERFLKNCSDVEIIETYLLLTSTYAKVLDKMNHIKEDEDHIKMLKH